MLVRYRCTNKNNSAQCAAGRVDCGYRQTVKHEVHDKACPKCGKNMTLDRSTGVRVKRQTCRCDGAPYPHRAGSLPLCEHARPDREDDNYWRHHDDSI